jgi:hypothetical protein
MTRKEVNDLLHNNPAAVEVGVYRIYQLQTADEKTVGGTRYRNGVGFGSRDARFGTSLAQQVENNRLQGGNRRLSDKQLRCALRLCLRYSRQLTAIANGDLSVPALPWLG